jgi:hypothetical protein
MKTKREEKLEIELRECRKSLHKEKQKNHDLIKSREKHKEKAKELTKTIANQTNDLKKNGSCVEFGTTSN